MTRAANSRVVSLRDFRGGDVAGRVSKALDAFTAQVSHSAQDWRAKAGTAARSTDRFVRTSPWQAVGAIALAGVAAGVLASVSARRARSRAANEADVTSEALGG